MEWINPYQRGTDEWREEVRRHNIDDSRIRRLERVELIAIRSTKGNGTVEFPTRAIVEYFTPDGDYITTDFNPDKGMRTK